MRITGIWCVGLALVLPPASAAAQTVQQPVQRVDVLGTWAGNFYYGESNSKHERQGWLALWPYGLWWFQNNADGGGDHGGARWRLVGDTLWLSYDWRYSAGTLDSFLADFLLAPRELVPGVSGDTVDPWLVQKGYPNGDNYLVPGVADTVDTLRVPGYVRNDSLFWVQGIKREYAHYVGAYKISLLPGERISLTRLDSLSDLSWVGQYPKTMVLRRVKSPIPAQRSARPLPPGWPYESHTFSITP